MGILDIIVFAMFVVCVVTLGLYKSRNEKSGEDYFLAGRGLKWWLIGFSLIAANISSEQFVGMSGNAASHVGLAIASFEWIAAITMVVVAFGFLPYFLKVGIYTIPEFLEHRYDPLARAIMALLMLLIYMLLLGAVTYSGALTINTMAEEMGSKIVPTISQASLIIGIIAMVYVAAGGLKACAWADLIQGSALIVGGAIIMFFAFKMLGNVNEAAYIEDTSTGAVAVKSFTQTQGSIERFLELNKVRLNMFLPKNDTVLPYTALLLGLWIPNIYYWGLNQYIMQRTLGSTSLAEGQRGIVFAAFMKLLVPFVVVIPGVIAFNLFASEMKYKAVADNAPVIALYQKANPATQLVKVAESPSLEVEKNWPAETFILAIFPDAEAEKSFKVKTPFVLPIIKADYDKLKVRPFTVFKSDDKSTKTVFPALVAELEVYNQAIERAANAAGTKVHTEKLISYKYDSALGQLLSRVLPRNTGICGFVLAALLGAVVSSLAAMLNASSTIFAMDMYKKYLCPQASQKAVVFWGRVSVIVFSVIAVLLAPVLGNPKFSHSIFIVIQESQGLIEPGIVSVFAFGLLSRRAPRISGTIGLLTSIIVYGGMTLGGRYNFIPEVQFLNRIAITFGVCLLILLILRVIKPLPQPISFQHNTTIELHSSKGAMVVGVAVIIATLVLYAIFSPLGIAK